MNSFSYLLSFIEGILTFVSPCILPLLPLYFAYLAGSSNFDSINKKNLLKNSLGFVIGFTVIFVLLGASATLIGSLFKNYYDVFQKISGIIMIMFGLNFIGVINLKLLNFEKRIAYKYKNVGFFNSIIFGSVFGFGWTPCVGVFLGSALLMAGNSNTIWQGILLLFIYSLGLGIPFILSSIAFGSMENILSKIQKHHKIINIISGFILILAGLLLFANKMQYLTLWSF